MFNYTIAYVSIKDHNDTTMKKQLPLVSIVITTKNEEIFIEALLKSIQSQTYSSIEIIVVDNHSSDRTQIIAQKYTQHIYTVGPERSAQRNFGAEKAEGEFLLFLDADMVLEKNVVDFCVNKMTKKTGGVIVPEQTIGESFWAKVKSYERSFYVGDETIEAARFFSTNVFKKMHGFDESITGPEDWEFSDRVRKKHDIGRITSYIIHNEGNLSLLDLMKKKYYYARKTRQYLKKANVHPVSSKTLFFMRTSFYKNPKKILFHPILFCAMIFMLSAELGAGAIGYLTN